MPKPTPSQTWMWGKINHFDFKERFIQQFPALVSFYAEKSFQNLLDTPYDPEARELPDRWHEGHSPAVHFLTEEEDAAFMPMG